MLKKIRLAVSSDFNKGKVFPIIAIFLFSFLLLLPQLVSKGIIAGSDFLFHYNRFYETAMQIKTGNYNYFLSLFGFYSSGRIVNALYGPYFAYFQGILVLLSKNWFTYQLVSRFVLSSIAGLSMYSLLKQFKIKPRTSLLVALFYITTFSIQYWTFRQGFSSWGAAIMPWCLIPAIEFIKDKKISIIRLAVSVAIMMQVHMLSALFLIVAYLPFYLYGFVKSTDKKNVFIKGIIAVFLSLLLTANVWGALIEVGATNNLVEPFVNSKLYIMTVNQKSFYWLITPIPLLLIMLYQLYFTFKHWRHFDVTLRVITGTFFVFFVLSSSVFPWYQVNKLNLSIVNLIQFPFRFFVPATILCLVAFALILERYFDPKWWKLVTLVLVGATAIGLFQNFSTQNQSIKEFYTAKYPIKNKKHQFVIGSSEQVRASFYSSDLHDLLNLVAKSTPDYLPSDVNNTDNKYGLYEDFVLRYTDNFEKSQIEGDLIYSWVGETNEAVNIPAAKYGHTQLELNGKILTPSNYSLSGIGTFRVQQQVGKNTLEISYKVSPWFNYLLVINLLSWLTIILFGLFLKLKYYKSYKKIS